MIAYISFQLEDKRVEAEKKLISLKVQHDSLKSQYNMNKQHMHKIKVYANSWMQNVTQWCDMFIVQQTLAQLYMFTCTCQH